MRMCNGTNPIGPQPTPLDHVSLAKRRALSNLSAMVGNDDSFAYSLASRNSHLSVGAADKTSVKLLKE